MKTPVVVWLALLAAALFGGSTPFVKLLIGERVGAGCSVNSEADVAANLRGYDR